MPSSQPFAGVLVPVLTPFTGAGEPDAGRFVAFCRWLLDEGADGLAIFGTTSEANSMSASERMALLDRLVADGIPAARLMPGAGACSTTEATTLIRHAVGHGCGGVLMLPPFYYKGMTDQGVFDFIAAVIDRVASPALRMYLYHIPPQTMIPFGVDLVGRLVAAYPGTIAGLKDSSGDWANTKALLDAKFPNFGVFPGSEVFLLDGLRHGGVGCITASGNVNVPGIRKVYENWRTPQADQLQAEITRVRMAIQKYPMVPALKRIVAHFHGDPSWTAVRPPMERLSEAQSTALLADLAAIGYSLGERPREAAEERSMADEQTPSRTPERQAFYDKIAPANLAPLWEQLHSLVTPTPVPKCLPAIWHYREVRPHLMQSGALITAPEATRRVLMLMNPGLGGQASITGSLFAGLQLIMPGEVAPAHRHTQSALRFIIEGHGAYTAVDGERTAMEPGDFVITPSWTWHDHGNNTSEPMVWLDGLDIQIVSLLNASFAEGYPDDTQPIARPEGDSFARYGSNLLPVDWRPEVKTSPVFNYPYARTREALAALAKNGAADPYHGHKLRYVNPASGEAAMPTIATFVQLLPSGFASLPYRSTDGTVFVCVEGEGETRIGDTVLAWEPHDVFVVPSWTSHTHRATREAVLFSFSDRVVQEKLGLWREARGNA